MAPTVNHLVSPSLSNDILDDITAKQLSRTQQEGSLEPGNTVGPEEHAADGIHYLFLFQLQLLVLKLFETHPPSHVSYDVHNDVACCC